MKICDMLPTVTDPIVSSSFSGASSGRCNSLAWRSLAAGEDYRRYVMKTTQRLDETCTVANERRRQESMPLRITVTDRPPYTKTVLRRQIPSHLGHSIVVARSIV